MRNLADLIKNVQEVTTGETIEFMVGREKAELPMGQILTVVDYDYLNGDNGEYVVFICREDQNHFFFGGSVVTDKFKKIDQAFIEFEKEELLANGIELVATKKKSNSTKRIYTDVLFFPNHI